VDKQGYAGGGYDLDVVLDF